MLPNQRTSSLQPFSTIISTIIQHTSCFSLLTPFCFVLLPASALFLALWQHLVPTMQILLDFCGRPERDEILTPIDTLISSWLAPFCGLRDFATIMFLDICVYLYIYMLYNRDSNELSRVNRHLDSKFQTF
jgi:hypothetical protein